MSNHNDLDKDTSDDDAHGWNHRENEKHFGWYLVLIAVCGVIAWLLSTMGK